MKLSDIVDRINGNVDRFTTDLEYYIGGEHIDSNELEISRGGNLKENLGKLGFKFHFAFQDRDVIFMARNPHLRKAGMVMFSGLCSDASYILRSKDENVITQEFLAVQLQSDHFWDYCERTKVGSVNFANNWTSIANYEFDLPSIDKQKEIAKKVWAAYNLKKSYRKLLSATQEMVKSQFIEMFGDTHMRSNYSRQWKEVVEIINGKDYKSIQVEDGGYPVYGTGGEMARASDYLSPANSILLGRKGTLDKPLLIREKYWNVDTAFGAVPDEKVLHYVYFYWHCKTIDFNVLNKGTTLPSTTKVDLLNLWIKIPSMEEQTRFASIVEQADKSEFELRKSIEAIDQVIQSLINNQ